MQRQPSTASVLAKKLIGAGVPLSEVGPQHLMDVYASLRTVRDRANFAGVPLISGSGKILPVWPDEVVAVIIETRAIPQLEYVIKNIAQVSGLRVHVFHGAANRHLLQRPDLLSMISDDRLRHTEISAASLDANGYNALVLSQHFWERLHGRRKILFFQTDALCCPDSDFHLTDFLAWDYIGASWPIDRPVGIRIHGGVGGFSLRDWSLSVDALARFPPRFWSGGEDGYFAFHLDLMGAEVADAQTMAQFGTQSFFRYKSFGAHRVQSLSCEDHRRFLVYCPEVVNVLKWRKM